LGLASLDLSGRLFDLLPDLHTAQSPAIGIARHANYVAARSNLKPCHLARSDPSRNATINQYRDIATSASGPSIIPSDNQGCAVFNRGLESDLAC
jgi:hypothetical protein